MEPVLKKLARDEASFFYYTKQTAIYQNNSGTSP